MIEQQTEEIGEKRSVKMCVHTWKSVMSQVLTSTWKIILQSSSYPMKVCCQRLKYTLYFPKQLACFRTQKHLNPLLNEIPYNIKIIEVIILRSSKQPSFVFLHAVKTKQIMLIIWLCDDILKGLEEHSAIIIQSQNC